MKILNICQDDFANFAYDNMRALRSVGLDCDCIKLQSHSFYKEQAEVTDLNGVKSLIKNYDIIQFFHDNIGLYREIAVHCLGKRIIAYHTSSVYRRDHTRINAEFDKWNVSTRVACMPEFVAMRPGSIYCVGAVDTDAIQSRNFDRVYKFAHFPSNPTVKGSQNVYNVLNELGVSFSYNTDIIPHKEQLSRIEDCEIYIEMCTTQDGLGSPYGNFGITALEAAALGKIVITQCKDIDVYLKAYGDCALELISGPEKLKRTITAWDNYNGDHLKGQQKAVRNWVVKHHSLKATGEYIKKNIL